MGFFARCACGCGKGEGSFEWGSFPLTWDGCLLIVCLAFLGFIIAICIPGNR